MLRPPSRPPPPNLYFMTIFCYLYQVTSYLWSTGRAFLAPLITRSTIYQHIWTCTVWCDGVTRWRENPLRRWPWWVAYVYDQYTAEHNLLVLGPGWPRVWWTGFQGRFDCSEFVSPFRPPPLNATGKTQRSRLLGKCPAEAEQASLGRRS